MVNFVNHGHKLFSFTHFWNVQNELVLVMSQFCVDDGIAFVCF